MTSFDSCGWPEVDAFQIDDGFGNLIDLSWNAFMNRFLDDSTMLHFTSWDVTYH